MMNKILAVLSAACIGTAIWCISVCYAPEPEPEPETTPTTEVAVESTEPETESVPETAEVVIVTTEATVETEHTHTYLGRFILTAYCSCEKCCGEWALTRPLDENGQPIVYTASGARAYANHTVAVDPKVIPYGTELIINGQVYVAEDCGGGIKNNHIDVYFDSHEAALQFGYQEADVYLND